MTGSLSLGQGPRSYACDSPLQEGGPPLEDSPALPPSSFPPSFLSCFPNPPGSQPPQQETVTLKTSETQTCAAEHKGTAALL